MGIVLRGSLPGGRGYESASLAHEQIVGGDFSGLRVGQLSVWDCRLEGCSFERSRFQNIFMGSGGVFSEYVECSFEKMSVSFMMTGRARFVRCSFRGARIKGWNSEIMDLVDCDFEGALLKDPVFWGAPSARDLKDSPGLRRRNEFRGNDFSGAQMPGAAFRSGIDLDAQKLPVDERFVLVRGAPAALERGRELVASWGSGERGSSVDNATGFLDGLERESNSGQEDVFLDRPLYGKIDLGHWEALREVLAI